MKSTKVKISLIQNLTTNGKHNLEVLIPKDVFIDEFNLNNHRLKIITLIIPISFIPYNTKVSIKVRA